MKEGEGGGEFNEHPLKFLRRLFGNNRQCVQWGLSTNFCGNYGNVQQISCSTQPNVSDDSTGALLTLPNGEEKLLNKKVPLL